MKKILLPLLALALLALACGAPRTTQSPPTAAPSPIPPTAPPAGPTALPSLAPTAPSSVPYLDLYLSAETLSVGDTLTVHVTPVGIGLPYYYFSIRDDSTAEFNILVSYQYTGELTPADPNPSRVLAFESVSQEDDTVVFLLRAIGTGTVEIVVNATGEVNQDGAWVWSGGGSQTVQVEVR